MKYRSSTICTLIILCISIALPQSSLSSIRKLSILSSASCLPGAVYLPNISRSEKSYFEGPQEQEPNNDIYHANGPLRSGKIYNGYPNDQQDYFSINLISGGLISANLANDVGQGVQLVLRDSNDNFLDYAFRPPYTIQYNAVLPGWYYILVFNETGFNNTQLYSLNVTYTSQTSQYTSVHPSSLPICEPIGYNFESGIENWTTSEGEFKTATLITTTGIEYSGSRSLQLYTELRSGDQDVYLHTEAVAYFDAAVPDGIDRPGPYNLQGRRASCQVFLPQNIEHSDNPRLRIYLFAKDKDFNNQYSDAMYITNSITDQWNKISLIIGVDRGGDADFQAAYTNALGIRIEIIEDVEYNDSISIYIDHCTIQYPWPSS